jgi:predicted MPP superfamily phosphohydrolase
MPAAARHVRIAALADIHCSRVAPPDLHSLFAQISESCDVLLLCGDMTDYGLPEEARALCRELSADKDPKVGVLGNHDYQTGHED